MILQTQLAVKAFLQALNASGERQSYVMVGIVLTKIITRRKRYMMLRK